MRKILSIIFIIGTLLSQDWELTINIQDVGENAFGDYITMECCDGCHDGFHYSEDEYDLPNPPTDQTDLNFHNFNWVGSIDDNGVQCDNPKFISDKKSHHPASDLLVWNISGNCPNIVLENGGQVNISWEPISLDDKEIYLYINGQGTNMETHSQIYTFCENLNVEYDIIDGVFYPNYKIQILVGGCASTGLTTFYFDEDMDGHGSSTLSAQYCMGYEPEGWVSNSDDLDDTIYCLSNQIDDCDICDGFNNSIDCTGTCFGESEIDDCGVCNGYNQNMDCFGICFGESIIDECGECGGNGIDEGECDCDGNILDCAGDCDGDAFIDYCGDCNGYNSSCPEEVFGDGPTDLYAQETDEGILLTWLFDDQYDSGEVIGTNIYYIDSPDNTIFIDSTDELSYMLYNYESGTFCVAGVDIYQNESQLTCIESSEYMNFMFNLYDGANLISFPYLPSEDVSIENIFSDVQDSLTGIISNGVAASNTENDGWVGSLSEIERRLGYWVKVDILNNIGHINLSVSGLPTDPYTIYELDEGANLISYIGPDNLHIDQAISENIIDAFSSIIGQGVAANRLINPNTGNYEWFGSLEYLQLGKGYWIKLTEPVNMVWNPSSMTWERSGKINTNPN